MAKRRSAKKKATDRKITLPLCMVKDCGQKADGPRGQCSSCYYASRRAIAAGETSWSDLIARGYATGDRRHDIGARRTHLGKLLAGKS